MQRAKAIGEQATGPAEPLALPSHVTVSGDVVACGMCGKTFALSKQKNARANETRAFAAIHSHV